MNFIWLNMQNYRVCINSSFKMFTSIKLEIKYSESPAQYVIIEQRRLKVMNVR